ncbi:hypothetical protein NMG60_11007962 [Bertholletia excelsa]
MEISLGMLNSVSLNYSYGEFNLHRVPRTSHYPHCNRLAAISRKPNFSVLFCSQVSKRSQILGVFDPLSASRTSDCLSRPSQLDTFVPDSEPLVMVVLLGWLGSKPNNLNRYVELYRSRGIQSVVFVVSMSEVLLDLGRTLEERIGSFARELSGWLCETRRDGRERFLLFHTFSNTGWLVYGIILSNMQSQQDLLMRIKGCVVDSGGDPDINPKIWAAGFTAALLKKRSSSINHPTEVGKGMESEVRLSRPQHQPLLIETILLFVLEMLFSFMRNLPGVNERLTRITFILSNKQPPCPQLYLYSTADKVIPQKSIELFIEEQRRTGRRVQSFNFCSSPHLEHYRSFPSIYMTQIMNFLHVCVHMPKIK